MIDKMFALQETNIFLFFFSSFFLVYAQLNYFILLNTLLVHWYGLKVNLHSASSPTVHHDRLVLPLVTKRMRTKRCVAKVMHDA